MDQKMFNAIASDIMHIAPEIKNLAMQKTDEGSEECRFHGNEFFRKQNFFCALWLYNKSIAFAESKSAASLGYGNRSAVYFELKRYEDCLKNIQLARENDYPENKLPKLIEREEKCKKLMMESMDVEGGEENLWDFFKLSYPANEKIPFVVDRVEMRQTEKYGRGIYAKQDLKAGDIICIEEPAVNYAEDESVYMRCFNCFKTNALNLIPCDTTASMMFCSAACKENFNAKAIEITEMLCSDVKMLSDIAQVFGSVNRFDEFIQRIDPKKDLNTTIFDYNWNNPDDPLYKRNLMLCFLSLSTNDKKVNKAHILEKYISEKTSHHLLSIYNLNFQKLRINNGDSKAFRVGWCIPLFSSLINYSCIRNACPLLVDNKIVTIMQKPVKAGEQIFFCYPSEESMFAPFAKNMIEVKQKFECDCELCANKIKRDPKEHDALLEPFKNEPNHAYDRDYDKVKEYLKDAWNVLNNNPATVNGYSPHMLQTMKILEAIAFQCAYPFVPPEPKLF